LRAIVSLFVLVAFAAIGALAGILLSLPSGGLGAAPGGGHGGSAGNSLAHPQVIVLLFVACGIALALVVVWGISRNHGPSRWFGATSVSALAILLACFIPVWRYPLLFEVAALLVPVLCGAFLYTESRGARQRGSGA
jgi:hypothetical protein